MTNDRPRSRSHLAVTITTDIPARLDRLAWSRFHTLVVVALGITWILDGLEVTLAGAVAGALRDPASLQLSNADIGLSASAYLAGAVGGALFFGWATDRLGRKRLFFITLFLYIAATAATAFAWNLASFALFRFLTGAGIGGEYTAINSTIQELTPARLRGRVDLAINGSFWVGAAIGALGSIVLLDPAVLGPDLGWRVCFGIGAALGLAIIGLRTWIPESPRWLMLRGRLDEANAIVEDIERRARAPSVPDPLRTIRLVPRDHTPWREIVAALLVTHRRRSLVGLALMASQAFFYNAIFFTYALVLTNFYGVPAAHVGWYLLPFALGNFAGPLLLGPWFDSLGRRTMIATTYALSGVLLAASGWLFAHGVLDAVTQTIAWGVIFFFASAAASSAYLTVSETFPLEIRALAIAVFYAIGTALGGIAGPILFGVLIDSGSRDEVLVGYLVGAGAMIAAAVVQAVWGVSSERRSLEDVATPLAAVRD